VVLRAVDGRADAVTVLGAADGADAVTVSVLDGRAMSVGGGAPRAVGLATALIPGDTGVLSVLRSLTTVKVAAARSAAPPIKSGTANRRRDATPSCVPPQAAEPVLAAGPVLTETELESECA
jgi:hypothetical protein